MKILLSLAFVLAFCAVGYGQTPLTKTSKELKTVENQISTVQKQIIVAETEKARLLVRYEESFPEVKKQTSIIDDLRESLTSLEAQRSSYVKTKLIQDLPDNNIQLLKMIVIQNERIIELLEKLAKQ